MRVTRRNTDLCSWIRLIALSFAGAAVMLLTVCTGCNLFRFGLSDRLDKQAADPKNRGTLSAVRRVRDTVGLEIIFAERPVGDPLLSDKSLWEGVDTVGELRPELRRRLQKNGFKIGHMSSTPNQAVETILGLTSQSIGTRAPVREKQLTGRRVVRPSGGETEIQTSRFFPTFSIRLDDLQQEPIQVKNARCVLRVKAEKLEEGWARLEFTPQIHHGRLEWRAVATGTGLKGSTSQRIHSLYSHRFSITLNVGEMVLITGNPNLPGSLGAKFFIAGAAGNRVQRVLFIRLANVTPSKSAISTER